MNNITYLAIAALALTTLYLLIQLRGIRGELESTYQILDSKCNRLNTMIQNGESSRPSNDSPTIQNNQLKQKQGHEEEYSNTFVMDNNLKQEIEELERKEQELNANIQEGTTQEESTLEEHVEIEYNKETKTNVFDDIPFSLSLHESTELSDEQNLKTMETEEETMEAEEETIEEEEAEEVTIEEAVEEELKELDLDNIHNEKEQNLNELTVKELKAIAGKMSLRVGGNKTELVDRINLANSK